MYKEKFSTRLRRDLKRNWPVYFMCLPVVLYYVLFSYKPMYGVLIAFQDYRPARGFGVDWVGFQQFRDFFNSPYAYRLIRNTVVMNVLLLVFGFPASILLALLLNELRSNKFKNVSQMFMHLPHFISMVVVCGMVKQFCLSDGVINDIIAFFGGERVSLLTNPKYYRTIYVVSDIWQGIGWGSLIYVAALSGVDKELYDAASVDGAGRLMQAIHVTLPSITPTIVVMLILRIGGLMSLGYEKTLLLSNEAIYETADIISTYVYRYGLMKQQYSYSTAVGLFNSVINVFLVVFANWSSRKLTENSLW